MAALTPSSEDYVKTIWSISEWNGLEVVPTELARRMDLSPSTVTEAVKKLARQGLVDHKRYGPIRLTAKGHHEALRMVRKHRLIETFLYKHLGYSWEALHDEAEALEHAVSDRFITAIDELLGRPMRDPHGDPIPREDGSMPEINVYPLTDVEPGSTVVVSQVDDDNPDVLVYLGDLGVKPGASGTVVSQATGLGLTNVEINGREIALPLPAARRIRATTE